MSRSGTAMTYQMPHSIRAAALEGGFGFFQYFLRDDRRTVHDRIAETIVIAAPRQQKR